MKVMIVLLTTLSVFSCKSQQQLNESVVSSTSGGGSGGMCAFFDDETKNKQAAPDDLVREVEKITFLMSQAFSSDAETATIALRILEMRLNNINVPADISDGKAPVMPRSAIINGVMSTVTDRLKSSGITDGPIIDKLRQNATDITAYAFERESKGNLSQTDQADITALKEVTYKILEVTDSNGLDNAAKIVALKAVSSVISENNIVGDQVSIDSNKWLANYMGSDSKRGADRFFASSEKVVLDADLIKSASSSEIVKKFTEIQKSFNLPEDSDVNRSIGENYRPRLRVGR